MKSLFLILDKNESLQYRENTMSSIAYLECKANELIGHLNKGHATLTARLNDLESNHNILNLGDSINQSFVGLTLVTAKRLADTLNSADEIHGLFYLHLTIEVETKPTYTGTW